MLHALYKCFLCICTIKPVTLIFDEQVFSSVPMINILCVLDWDFNHVAFRLILDLLNLLISCQANSGPT